MKRMIASLLMLIMILAFATAGADGWSIPDNHGGSGGSTETGIRVQLIEDLATRSGPSTEYTGCGSYRMNGEFVTALARAYDKGGVLWVEVSFSYGGGYRRAWTGAKRLDISESQLMRLPEDDHSTFLGYGTVTGTTVPRFGPSSLYATYSDRNFRSGDQVAVIRYQDGFYMVECYHTDGKILRSWIPENSVQMNDGGAHG